MPKKVTYAASIYCQIEVPDECPDDPKLAHTWIEENGLYSDGYEWETMQNEHIVFIDQYDVIDGVEEYARCIYEE